MYCTVKEIIRDVLDTDVPDSECVFAVVLTRGDVRHIAQDWSLTDDELETVMQRLDDAFEYGADVSVVHGVVRELMEEKRASRQVTVPAVMLEKVLALAGSEMKRLYAVGSENGATVMRSSGKNAKQWTLCYRRWTGSTCHEYQHRNPRNSAQLQSRD
uniref:DUF1380 domain-containing protein n=7 Tax=Enterobacterales TaxID=91347 RepID=A0A2S1PPC5_ECOLX|nr:hypothetical protein [Escherichia coli]